MTRRPRIGDIVWLGYDDDVALVPIPAIVVKIDEPSDPEHLLGVVAFCRKQPGMWMRVTYSPTLAGGAWSWPD